MGATSGLAMEAMEDIEEPLTGEVNDSVKNQPPKDVGYSTEPNSTHGDSTNKDDFPEDDVVLESNLKNTTVISSVKGGLISYFG